MDKKQHGIKQYKVYELSNREAMEDTLNQLGKEAWIVEQVQFVECTSPNNKKKKNDELKQYYLLIVSKLL